MNETNEQPSTDLWSRIQSQPRPTRAIDFPRKVPDGNPLPQIHMRVLTQEEQSIATAAAHDFAKKMLHESDDTAQRGKSLGYDLFFAQRFLSEVLARACLEKRDDGEMREAFRSANELARVVTTSEIEVLGAHYEATVEAFDPDAEDGDPTTEATQ